jgi:serine/threonine protein kinase
MKRTVALKSLPIEWAATGDALGRFRREARAAALLQHPNLVTVLDADEVAGIAFLVMPFIEGSDLAAFVRREGPLPVERAVDLVVQAAQGLSFAHSRGVIHRNVEPANLMLDRSGTLRVLDLGVARIAEQSNALPELTRTGRVLGSGDFVAPEQAVDARLAGPQSDVYSLGMTFWFLLTGRPAYPGQTLLEKLEAHRQMPVPSICEVRGDVPHHIEAVICRMIAKSPADRYPSMQDVVAALSGRLPAETAPAASDPGLATFLDGLERLRVERAVPGQKVQAEVNSSRPGNQLPVPRRQPHTTLAIVAGSVVVVVLLAMAFRSPRDGAQRRVNSHQSESASNSSENADRRADSAVERPTEFPPIVADHALRFDGNLGYVDTPIPHFDLSESDLTIEMWVTLARPLERWCTLAGLGDGNGNGCSLHYNALGPHWGFDMAVGTRLKFAWNAAIAVGRRTHMAAVWNRTTPLLYVDGVAGPPEMRGEFEIAGGANEPTLRLAGIPAIAFGASVPGELDEIRISTIVRYDRDFTPPARLESDRHTLVLYHCDEGGGEFLRDDSGHARHGRIHDATWVRVPEDGAVSREPR